MQRPPLQSIWILRDITANKQAEQEREAARSAMALAEISTILAHEIRNPLASMELFAGLIDEDPGTDLAVDLSIFAPAFACFPAPSTTYSAFTAEANRTLRRVDLTACMQSGVEFVQPIAEQAGVSLSFLAADDSLTIQGNENATPPDHPEYRLQCNSPHTGGRKIDGFDAEQVSRQGTIRALVEIKDTGCGMPENIVEHIFDAGFSANGDTPGPGPGCLQAAHEPTRRRDSRFKPGELWKHFPIGVSDLMTRDEAPSVMVVDDEPGIRTALRANFLRHGWRVETACVRARSGAQRRGPGVRLGRHRYSHAGWHGYGSDALGAASCRRRQPSSC